MDATPDQLLALLGKLATKEDSSSTLSQIAPTKPGKPFAAVGLKQRSAVQALLDDAVAAGWVSRKRAGRTDKFAITPQGIAHLATLTPSQTDGDAELLAAREAFLLLQPLSASDGQLTEGQANKLPKAARDRLKLTGTLASQLRAVMMARGHLRQAQRGRSLWISLTDTGLAHLATLKHPDDVTYVVTGAALNALLAARGASQRQPANDRNVSLVAPSAAPDGEVDLGSAAYAIFSELKRERFSRTGFVPIFEVRREIARRHGPAAARHDRLDGAILDLWSAGRVRLVSISDTRDASAAELDESITDSFETLFYMEDADDRRDAR